MAQRRSGDLPRSIVVLPYGRLEPEEQRPRPAATGDLARDLRQRAVALSAEQYALLEHRHLMTGSAPLPNQDRARSEPACRRGRRGAARSGVLGDPPEQSPRARLEAAEHALLQSIGDRASQQIFADAGRRFGAVKRPPTLPQSLRTQSGKAGEFAGEFIGLGV